MKRTNCDGLDLDALLDVGGRGIIGVLMGENLFAAEGVDEGGTAWGDTRWSTLDRSTTG